jgi:hypothetical protein
MSTYKSSKAFPKVPANISVGINRISNARKITILLLCSVVINFILHNHDFNDIWFNLSVFGEFINFTISGRYREIDKVYKSAILISLR